MIDFDALVFGPVYDVFGQPAVLATDAGLFDLVVIDHTRGVTVDESGGMVGVQTIRPAADIRRSVLNALGISKKRLLDAQLTFGGASWQIKTVLENGDELRLILMASDIDADDLPAYLLTEFGERRLTEAGAYRVLE